MGLKQRFFTNFIYLLYTQSSSIFEGSTHKKQIKSNKIKQNINCRKWWEEIEWNRLRGRVSLFWFNFIWYISRQADSRIYLTYNINEYLPEVLPSIYLFVCCCWRSWNIAWRGSYSNKMLQPHTHKMSGCCVANWML